MLILSRQRGEIIDVGGGITVTVVDIRGDKVRIGVQAPKETPVHRREVTVAIGRQQQAEAKRMVEAQAGKVAS